MRSPNQPPPSEVRAARNRSSSTPWRSRILPLCLRSSPPSRCSSLAPSRVCSSGWGSVWGGDPLSEGSFCAFLQCSVQEITAGRKRTRNDVTRHDAINAVLRAETIRGWVNWSTPSCGILLETWLGKTGFPNLHMLQNWIFTLFFVLFCANSRGSLFSISVEKKHWIAAAGKDTFANIYQGWKNE